MQDELGLSIVDSQWSYSEPGKNGKDRTLSLDARIPLAAVRNDAARIRIKKWIMDCAESLHFAPEIRDVLTGTVFEVRQGYKSKDSKRQNADIRNASTAITKTYLPCIIVLSSQIDTSIADRYRASQWGLLTGSPRESSPIYSTYRFMEDVIGYDLAGFFERNSKKLQQEINQVLSILISTNSIESDERLDIENE